MIFGSPPSFERVLEALVQLEQEVNSPKAM